MGRDEAAAAPSADLGRYEAQRIALGGLLARFTADRDALIGAVHECEERIGALAERLDALSGAGGGLVANAAPPGATIASDDLRLAIAEMRAEHRDAVSRLRAEVEHATERANEALRHLDAAPADQSLEGRDIEDVEEVRRAVGCLGEEIVQLRRMFDERLAAVSGAEAAGRPDEAVAELAARVERLGEDLAQFRSAVDERLAAAQGADAARTDEAVAELGARVDRLGGDLAQFRSAVDERLAAVCAAEAAGRPDEAVAELAARVERLEAGVAAVREHVGNAGVATQAGELGGGGSMLEVHLAALRDLRDQVIALKAAALHGPNLRNVWVALVVAVLVAVIGVAATSFG